MTLRIEESSSRGSTVFTLSGSINAGHIKELKGLFGPRAGYETIILDLRELQLADREAVRFLARCRQHGMTLKNCPAYIRKWMARESGLQNEES